MKYNRLSRKLQGIYYRYYICHNHKKSRTFWKKIITDASLNQMLEDMNIPTASSETVEKKYGCNMFVLSGIIYDNPLLNDPILVEILAKNKILSQVLNADNF